MRRHTVFSPMTKKITTPFSKHRKADLRREEGMSRKTAAVSSVHCVQSDRLIYSMS